MPGPSAMLEAMTEARTDARTATPVPAIVRAERLVGGWVDSRWTVAVAAAAAFLLRLPGLTRPVRADEAGYQLVARAWHPLADSVYGAYFVDRPPPMIALFKVSDAIGGPLFIRVLGAFACAALVLAARGGGPAGRRRARRALDRGRDGRAQHQRAHRRGGGEGRAARAAGADVPASGCRWWRSGTESWRLALAAGLLAGLALGFKQNLAGGVVFAAVLLHRVVAGGAADPAGVRPAGRCRVGRLRGAGARHRRVGAGGRRTPAHAVVRRLRLPLRRQPGALRRHRQRADLRAGLLVLLRPRRRRDAAADGLAPGAIRASGPTTPSRLPPSPRSRSAPSTSSGLSSAQASGGRTCSGWCRRPY